MSGIVEELIKESRQEGISIGHAEAEKKYRAAEKKYIAELEALRIGIARLKTQQNKSLNV